MQSQGARRRGPRDRRAHRRRDGVRRRLGDAFRAHAAPSCGVRRCRSPGCCASRCSPSGPRCSRRRRSPSAARSTRSPAASGMLGEDAPKWEGLDVGSPFDYAQQGILYVARHLPPPGRDGLPEEALDELADAGRGGRGTDARPVLVDARRPSGPPSTCAIRVDVPILCQGDDATAQLVRDFADDPSTCLVGTLSLWQGVDVPGASCSPRGHRPHPVPAPRRPAVVGSREGRRAGRRQRIPCGVSDFGRAAPGPGRGPADPLAHRPWGRRGARLAARHGALRRVPHAVAATVLAHHRRGGGAGCPAPPGRLINAAQTPRVLCVHRGLEAEPAGRFSCFFRVLALDARVRRRRRPSRPPYDGIGRTSAAPLPHHASN